jgi:hypothetical protein
MLLRGKCLASTRHRVLALAGRACSGLFQQVFALHARQGPNRASDHQAVQLLKK